MISSGHDTRVGSPYQGRTNSRSHDADAEWAKVRAFDDGDVDAAGVERKCGSEAADARPCHENVFSHVPSLGRQLP